MSKNITTLKSVRICLSAHRVKKLEWWGYRNEQEVWRYL